jgi:DNA primase small subunit
LRRMKLKLIEATPQERRLYYSEEWRPSDIPSFLRDSLMYREFGFDHDGRGPRDRYNEFNDTETLAKFLREKAPYSAYSSVSYYENPGNREGYQKAELVFDIDAKDLPPTLKKCCEVGQVCEKCLETAKIYILSLKDIFEGDFGINNLFFIYSGRGYHLRILDPDAMEFSEVERGYLVDYLSGSQEPKETLQSSRWLAPRGYTKIFKDRLLGILRAATVKDLMTIEDIGKVSAEKIIQNKAKIIDDIQNWKNFDIEYENKKKLDIIKKRRFRALNRILGHTKYDRLTDFILRQNASILDAKVTVDVKRILRLPSSLHSKAGLKCMLIDDLETFDPFSDAVPKFVSERND